MVDHNIGRFIGKEISGEDFIGLFPNLSTKLVKLEAEKKEKSNTNSNTNSNAKSNTNSNANSNKNQNHPKTGLNIFNKKFYGGDMIYFTNVYGITQWIHTDYERGCFSNGGYRELKYYRVVTLLPESKVYIKDTDVLKADRIFLSEKMEISDLPLWLDEDYCLKSVQYPHQTDTMLTFKYVKNFSIEVQKAAASRKYNKYVVEHLLRSNIYDSVDGKIIVPEEVLLAAVRFICRNLYGEEDCGILGFLLNRNVKVSKDVQIEAVKSNYKSVISLFSKKIEVPEEIKIFVVKKNGHFIHKFIEYCVPFSDDVLMGAIESSPIIVKDLIKLKIPISETVSKQMVKRNYQLIKYFRRPSEEMQLDAIKQHYNAIKLINKRYISESVKKYVDRFYSTQVEEGYMKNIGIDLNFYDDQIL